MTRLYNRTDQLEIRRQLRRQATEAEVLLWQYLRTGRLNGLRFRRQYGIGRFIVDFYCPNRRLAVELDGSPHLTDGGRARDHERDAWIVGLGIRIIRFTNDEVLNHFNGVMETLQKIFTPP